MGEEYRQITYALACALGLALGACEEAGSPESDAVPPEIAEPVPFDGPRDVVCGDVCTLAPSEHNTQVVQADPVPPPISGGTLLVTRDRKWLVATDPDRDQIYVIDAVARRFSHALALKRGDEPGRSVEDAAGRIHVALRGGHAIASLTLDPQAAIERRDVCALPRGLAFDAAHDALHVACAEGKLVSLPAAARGAITRTLSLERDVRDVVVNDDQLFVTRFRSAELLQLDADGQVAQRFAPPTFVHREMANSFGSTEQREISNSPTTAWRAVAVPGKGTLVLHQRARVEEVSVETGGYAGGACGGSIVQTSVTVGAELERAASADIGDVALAVDVAVDPEGTLLALAAPGNWGVPGRRQLQVYSLTGTSPLNPLADPALRKPASSDVVSPPPCLTSAYELPTFDGQVTAVAFVSADVLAVQEREPAAISFIDLRSARLLARLDLGQPTRFDTGHALFHLRARAGLSCASCHAEAGDDAHVWTFRAIGPRRTQNLRGGILGTEPLHWDGDMQDFTTLVARVLVERMASFKPVPGQVDALARWIDRQPAPAAAAEDVQAARRGRTLFESKAVGCATCHAGAQLTNNQSADVGTGGMFQVPSLRGVSFRLPLMHDGCAETLRARFEDTCGGAQHGDTAQLTEQQFGDLVAYLETL